MPKALHNVSPNYMPFWMEGCLIIQTEHIFAGWASHLKPSRARGKKCRQTTHPYPRRKERRCAELWAVRVICGEDCIGSCSFGPCEGCRSVARPQSAHLP